MKYKRAYEYKEAYEIIKILENKAYIANDRARTIIGKPYGNGSSDSIRFDERGAIFSYEHNTACHCHPEYITETYLIPWEWMDGIVTKYIIPPEQNIGEFALTELQNESNDETQLIALIEKHKIKLEENRLEVERQRQERIKEDEEENKRRRLEFEKAEFERLSKKFATPDYI